MGALIALAVIAALACLPLGIQAKYDEGGAAARLILGPLRPSLYPSKKKKKSSQKTENKKTDKAVRKQTADREKKGGSFSDFFPLLDALMDFLGDLLCRKLRVKKLQAKVTLAGDDPCDLAVNYGRAWAALGNLVPVLERFFVIKKRDLQVQCDFTAEKTLFDAHLEITITLGRLLHLGLRYGIRVLREYMKILKLRKGGAV
ncbi:MAG: DUF2953 domain-containing protein [Oscillospiraceae bacterium]|nr:DUF2953 domain-containing protein [Oscillospiraceae bacterium]